MKTLRLLFIVVVLTGITFACSNKKTDQDENNNDQAEMKSGNGEEAGEGVVSGGVFDCEKTLKLYQEILVEYKKYLGSALHGDKNAQDQLEKLGKKVDALDAEFSKVDMATMDIDCATKISIVSTEIQALVMKSLMGTDAVKDIPNMPKQ